MVHRFHPTAKSTAGTVLIPVTCDVCDEVSQVPVPKMPPMHAVWVGRGHAAAAQVITCPGCGRRATVELALAARVVAIPPQPFLSWQNKVGMA